jgi:hypothetical protein
MPFDFVDTNANFSAIERYSAYSRRYRLVEGAAVNGRDGRSFSVILLATVVP